ncbi:MAG: hypothetical protein RRZ69_03105 [Clostridia bacterium]
MINRKFSLGVPPNPTSSKAQAISPNRLTLSRFPPYPTSSKTACPATSFCLNERFKAFIFYYGATDGLKLLDATCGS